MPAWWWGCKRRVNVSLPPSHNLYCLGKIKTKQASKHLGLIHSSVTLGVAILWRMGERKY